MLPWYQGPGPGPGAGFPHPWWALLFGRLVPLLFLLGIAALVVWAVLRITDRRQQPIPPWWRGGPGPGDSAVEQARLRYARGEMSRDEFLQVSSDLQGGTSGPWAGATPPSTGPAPGEGGSAAVEQT